MAIESKYGNLSIANIPEDEPVFLLRAQDILALAAIRSYLELCAGAGCADAHLDGITTAAGRFARWQAANPGKPKLPDTP